MHVIFINSFFQYTQIQLIIKAIINLNVFSLNYYVNKLFYFSLLSFREWAYNYESNNNIYPIIFKSMQVKNKSRWCPG